MACDLDAVGEGKDYPRRRILVTFVAFELVNIIDFVPQRKRCLSEEGAESPLTHILLRFSNEQWMRARTPRYKNLPIMANFYFDAHGPLKLGHPGQPGVPWDHDVSNTHQIIALAKEREKDETKQYTIHLKLPSTNI